MAFTPVCCSLMPFSSFPTCVLARKADFISKIHSHICGFFYVVEEPRANTNGSAISFLIHSTSTLAWHTVGQGELQTHFPVTKLPVF